jgi:hypothetical protein
MDPVIAVAKKINYDIQRNNAQLAYNINKKKYYESIIIKNQAIQNKTITKYPPSYFMTSYNLMYYPQISTIPQ